MSNKTELVYVTGDYGEEVNKKPYELRFYGKTVEDIIQLTIYRTSVLPKTRGFNIYRGQKGRGRKNWVIETDTIENLELVAKVKPGIEIRTIQDAMDNIIWTEKKGAIPGPNGFLI